MRTFTIQSSQMMACPAKRMDANHFRVDGSCLCIGPTVVVRRLGYEAVCECGWTSQQELKRQAEQAKQEHEQTWGCKP